MPASKQPPADPFAGLAQFAEISQGFAGSLDIEDTLRTAIAEIMRALHAQAGSIFLLDSDGRELVCRTCAGPVDITGARLAAGTGIVGRVVRDNRAQMVRDARTHQDFSAALDEAHAFVTRSILCAPLSVRGEPLGAIELINKQGGDGLFDDGDLHLLTALAASAALAIRNARMAAALVEQERLRRELELARDIQRSLLPPEPAAGFPVHGLNIPARGVSGDFYDFLLLTDGRIAFALGDVAGKGMNASLLMAKTCSLFRCLGKTLTAPGELAARLNDELCETASRGLFVTLIAGVYDPRAGTVRLANAGHPPALLRASDGALREFPAAAPPLGVLAGIAFPEVELRLDGGALYIYSDGLSEGTLADGTTLAQDGVHALVQRYAALPARQRLETMVQPYLGQDRALHDDITLLLVEGAR